MVRTGSCGTLSSGARPETTAPLSIKGPGQSGPCQGIVGIILPRHALRIRPYILLAAKLNQTPAIFSVSMASSSAEAMAEKDATKRLETLPASAPGLGRKEWLQILSTSIVFFNTW